MKLEDRIESMHFRVWKAVMLCIATAALLAAALASAVAINGMLVRAPYAPAEVKPDERSQALHRSLSLDRFRLAEARAPLAWGAQNASRSGGEFAYTDAVQRISRNLDSYVKSAFPPIAPVPEATQWSVSHLMKSLDFKNEAEVRLYLATLESLSSQLAAIGPDQASLPEERRIDPNRVLSWHADRVQRTFRAIEQENVQLQKVYHERLVNYANRQTRTTSYIGAAVGAVAIFVFSVFLFVMIRIERDLRTMAVASVATAKQLNA